MLFFFSDCPSYLTYSADGVCFYQDPNAQSTWHNAYHKCNEISLNLPSIHSQDFNDKLRKSFNNWLWIGLKYNRTYNEFAWSDGTALDYKNWQPNKTITSAIGYCAYMIPYPSGYWSTNPCNYDNKYACV